MGFELPTVQGPRNRTGELKPNGLFVRQHAKSRVNETIPYENIKRVIGTDKDLEVIFHDGVIDPETQAVRKPIVFAIMEGSSHQILDMEKFIEGYVLAQNRGKMDEHGEAIVGIITQRASALEKEVVSPWPEFDMDRVQNRLDNAFSFA